MINIFLKQKLDEENSFIGNETFEKEFYLPDYLVFKFCIENKGLMKCEMKGEEAVQKGLVQLHLLRKAI